MEIIGIGSVIGFGLKIIMYTIFVLVYFGGRV